MASSAWSELTDSASTAARASFRRSLTSRRRIGSLDLVDLRPGEGYRPLFFVENEVLVDGDDASVVEELVRGYGGEVIAARPVPPRPAQLPGRAREIDLPPETLRVGFSAPPRGAGIDEAVERISARAREAGGLTASSKMALAVAALSASSERLGGRLGLNIQGDPASMPLSTVTEGISVGGTSSPIDWAAFTDTRIVDAWQLVDSFRKSRSLEFTTLAVIDNGFWLDASGAPMVASGQPGSDFGIGVLPINLHDTKQPVGGQGRASAPWHGNAVVSVAAGGVNNRAGAAGAGGTVAFPLLMRTDYVTDEILYGIRLCTAWGIDVVNLSLGIRRSGWSEFWDFPTSEWEKTFRFAADNGVIVVAAAGNDNLNLPDDAIVRPASRTPGVITVGALAVDNHEKRSDSNYGPSVHIWAPGTDVPVMPDPDSLGGSTWSQTSLAAPLVAGTAAMMRAVAPSLSSAEVRRLLVETGWADEGRPHVGRRLNAHAAVLAAIAQTLPDWQEPNDTLATARPLMSGPNGTLVPGLDEFAVRRTRSDTDFWSFSVTEYSSVSISLDWYDRLGNVMLAVLDIDGNAVEKMTVTTSIGRANRVATGHLPPGQYFVRVVGNAVTAYRLVAACRAIDLAPDMFEPNNSFDDATPLLFSRWPLDLTPGHGPGVFILTLHREYRFTPEFPPRRVARINSDFFTFATPKADGKAKPRVGIGSDEPVEVTLYRADKTVIQQWSGVTQMETYPPEEANCFLEVAGKSQTEYTLWVSMFVDPRIALAGLSTYEVLPPWWGDHHPIALVDPLTDFGVELGVTPAESGHAVGEAIVLDVLSDDTAVSVTAELIGTDGVVARSNGEDRGRVVIDTSELRPGNYLLRLTRPDGLRVPTIQVAAPMDGLV